MKAIDQALHALIQREPAPEEVAKFYKIKEICGFSEHDSVWALLLAFGHYEILYKDIPNSITEQTRQVLADHKLALEATAEAVERAVKASLIESVAKTSREMANKAIETGKILANQELRRKFIFALVVAFTVSVPVLGLVAWGAYQAGERSARGEIAVDAAWVQSPDGRAAKAFASFNNVRAMLDCAGFETRKDGSAVYCIPYDDKAKRSSGWRIR
ncbi:DUF6753 family protein [Paraburkholderia humisilvae]|uniref:Uncharacterized protein n=1 Tax=Paraburkholderia humisilvae TaxID=627669 RepID=A0A6J5DQQ2_9BURK|nr:DUF6753 family protein [Paraburkholderia humisilvae]CAB3755917.1 hypothetical protein LMG29542_02728 [Paraburkholderia humisilvae]